MQSDIDLCDRRHVVYQSFEGGAGRCPRCGGRLRQSRQTYSVATRRRYKPLDSFIIGSDFGWYCAACPVVVINSREVRELLGSCLPNWKADNEFSVEGIVDLDAIPKHKRHLSIGGADNPMPLIEFEDPNAPPKRQPLNKKQRQQRKKMLAQKLKGKRSRQPS